MIEFDYLGWHLDLVLHDGVHIQQDNDAAFSSAVESAGRDVDDRDAGRLLRLTYLATRKKRRVRPQRFVSLQRAA